jgi:hypothetical protein
VIVSSSRETVEVDSSEPAPELLAHLVVEFGDHGRRAVEFLSTAQRLFTAGPETAPRVAETIVYCLREAMKAIPASQDDGEGAAWKRGHCCVESDLAAMDRAAVPCLVRWFVRVR